MPFYFFSAIMSYDTDNFAERMQKDDYKCREFKFFLYFCSLLTKIDRTQRNDNRFFGSEF